MSHIANYSRWLKIFEQSSSPGYVLPEYIILSTATSKRALNDVIGDLGFPVPKAGFYRYSISLSDVFAGNFKVDQEDLAKVSDYSDLIYHGASKLEGKGTILKTIDGKEFKSNLTLQGNGLLVASRIRSLVKHWPDLPSSKKIIVLLKLGHDDRISAAFNTKLLGIDQMTMISRINRIAVNALAETLKPDHRSSIDSFKNSKFKGTNEETDHALWVLYKKEGSKDLAKFYKPGNRVSSISSKYGTLSIQDLVNDEKATRALIDLSNEIRSKIIIPSIKNFSSTLSEFLKKEYPSVSEEVLKIFMNILNRQSAEALAKIESSNTVLTAMLNSLSGAKFVKAGAAKAVQAPGIEIKHEVGK